MKGTRSVQIQSMPASAQEQILNKQRIHRPSSPHFTIYQPQLTWLGSIANRVTGVGFSVCELLLAFFCWENYAHASCDFTVLYGFSIAYLVAPTTFSSANVVEVIAGLPESVKYAGKAILAAPFAFHSFNGLRHLGWDMVKCMFFHSLV